MLIMAVMIPSLSLRSDPVVVIVNQKGILLRIVRGVFLEFFPQNQCAAPSHAGTKFVECLRRHLASSELSRCVGTSTHSRHLAIYVGVVFREARAEIRMTLRTNVPEVETAASVP